MTSSAEYALRDANMEMSRLKNKNRLLMEWVKSYHPHTEDTEPDKTCLRCEFEAIFGGQ